MEIDRLEMKGWRNVEGANVSLNRPENQKPQKKIVLEIAFQSQDLTVVGSIHLLKKSIESRTCKINTFE